MSAIVSPMTPSHPARADIAACLRAHLAVRSLSGSELARRIGLTQAQMSRRTTGRTPITTDELGLIADELGISIIDLIQMPKERPAGGGSTLHGIGTLIERHIVGRTGLEPVTDGL